MQKSTTSNKDLSMSQIERYSRQIIMKEIGSIGMEKLLQATVTVVGAGGLGCPVVQMLAAAGVGTIRVIDRDIVELTNLPRQFMHYTDDIGKPKVESIKEKVQRMNPDIHLETHKIFLDKANAEEMLSGSDYVIEASDSMPTKFLVNDVCVHLGINFTIAGVVQFYGQMISVIPGETTCYRCVFGKITEENAEMSCSGAGVLGTVPALAGIMQANEAIKSILGISSRLVNGMFSFNLFDNSFDTIPIKRNSKCMICSHPEEAKFKSLDYGDSLNLFDPEKTFF